jgi:hypothetical protein
MIMYVWYATNVITSCAVFSSVNQISLLCDKKLWNLSAASKHLFGVLDDTHFCVYYIYSGYHSDSCKSVIVV